MAATGGDQFLVKEGWLVKQGGTYKNWRKRWFVLKNNHISYHKERSKEPVGRITFSIVSSVSPAPDWDKKMPKRSHFRVNVVDGRSGGAFLIGANDEETMRSWVTAITETLENYRKAGVGTSALGHDAKAVTAYGKRPEEDKKMRPQRTGSESTGLVKDPRRLTMSPLAKKNTVTKSGSRLSLGVSSTNAADFQRIMREPENFDLDDEDSDEEGLPQEGELAMDSMLSEEHKAKEFYYAVSSGSLGDVKAWLQLGVNVNWVNVEEHNRTSLHAAVHRHDEDIIRDLMQAGASVNVQDASGSTPIHLATAQGQSAILSILLAQAGADPSIVDGNKRSATYIAVFSGRKDCAKALLALEIKRKSTCWTNHHLAALNDDKAALVATYDSEEKVAYTVSPLHVASAFDALSCVEHLLGQSGSPTLLRDDLQRTPAHYAAAGGSSRVLAVLADKGCDINDRDRFNKTPLHYAAGLGQVEVTKELVKRDCIIAKDQCNMTPLHVAAFHGQSQCVQVIVESCVVDVNGKADDELTPLFLATHSGNIQCMGVLLEAGANINLRVHSNLTATHEACRRDNVEALSFLIENKANLEAIDDAGNSPLLTAIRAKATRSALLLIEKGADISLRNQQKETPLSVAVDAGIVAVAEVLLEMGVDCNEQVAGITPLFTAAAHGNKPMTKLLLDCNAEVNVEDRWKSTPLLRAVSSGHSEVVEILLEAGANPNHQTSSGVTPLLDASHNNRIDCLELLLEAGALPNTPDNDGSSPMHEAAAAGNVHCLVRLLLYGANLDAKNAEGNTPLQVAASHGHGKAAMFCLANGAEAPSSVNSVIGSLLDAINGDTSAAPAKKEKKRRKKKDAARKAKSSLSQEVELNMSPSREEEPASEQPKEVPTSASDSSVDPVSVETAEEENFPPLPPTPVQAPPTDATSAIPDDSSETPASEPQDNMSQEATSEAEGNQPEEEKPSEQAIAKQYIKNAQEILSKDNYKKFHRMLLNYKKGELDMESLFEGVYDLLKGPETSELLNNFQTFLPDSEKQKYADFIAAQSTQ